MRLQRFAPDDIDPRFAKFARGEVQLIFVRIDDGCPFQMQCLQARDLLVQVLFGRNTPLPKSGCPIPLSSGGRGQSSQFKRFQIRAERKGGGQRATV